MFLLEEMQQSFLAVLVDFKSVLFGEDKLFSTRNLPGCPWQVVSSELSHRQDNGLLNHAFFLEQLGFHWELSSRVLTGHDFDLYLRSNITAIHSDAALALPRPCPSFSVLLSFIVLSTSTMAASPLSSLTPPPLGPPAAWTDGVNSHNTAGLCTGSNNHPLASLLPILICLKTLSWPQ